MSKEAVQTIIGQAVVDREFRENLFADPEEVLAGYELTDEEIVALKAMDAETVESFAGALDERISKALLVAGFEGGGTEGQYSSDYLFEGWVRRGGMREAI